MPPSFISQEPVVNNLEKTEKGLQYLYYNTHGKTKLVNVYNLQNRFSPFARTKFYLMCHNEKKLGASVSCLRDSFLLNTRKCEKLFSVAKISLKMGKILYGTRTKSYKSNINENDTCNGSNQILQKHFCLFRCFHITLI